MRIEKNFCIITTAMEGRIRKWCPTTKSLTPGEPGGRKKAHMLWVLGTSKGRL